MILLYLFKIGHVLHDCYDKLVGKYYSIKISAFTEVKDSVKVEGRMFFWNDNLLAKTGVGGSDMVLRVRQVIYPLVEVSNNIVFGHGFGWCGWYLGKYELHPILFGFETILSTAVCEFGIIELEVVKVLIMVSVIFASCSLKPFSA